MKEADYEKLAAMELFEDLDVITKTENITASEEGLQELWKATKERVLIMFGHHETMIKRIQEFRPHFDRLAKNVYVRAVLPKDLQAAVRALETVNDILAKCREGEALDMNEYVGPDLTNVGIELKQDGMLYASKFQHGDWGAGKGKSAINSPMTFKKSIEECHWDSVAPDVADAFLKEVREISKSKMMTSIDNHYRDLVRAVASKQEKAEVKLEKRVSLNQIRNLNAIRNVLIKFVFGQLMAVHKAYVPPKEDKPKDEEM